MQAFGSLPRPDLRDQGHGSWEDWEIQYGMRSDSAREAPRHAGKFGWPQVVCVLCKQP